MYEEEMFEYGIKYRVIKLASNKFILFPLSTVRGEAVGFDFKTEKKTFPLVGSEQSLENKYVIDSVFSVQELKMIYDFEDEDSITEEDEVFLSECFYDDYKEKITYIETDKDNNIVEKHDIDLAFLKVQKNDVTYLYEKNVPSVILNEDALNEILSCEDLKEVRILLEKYKKLLPSLEKEKEQLGVTKIRIVDGKVEEIETTKKFEDKYSSTNNTKSNATTKSSPSTQKINGSISYEGLRKAIKEKVFGHDEAIDIFAQKIYMNYTAQEGEETDSILLVGPTGTGKTETVNAACSYLDIPSVCVNASNLVPQGIKGMSIEDVILSLYIRAGLDLEKAQRGLIFLDEFDKLNGSDLEIKTPVKNILLTFTAGGTFPVDTDYHEFIYDSSMAIKIFSGVFDKITETKKEVGFDISSAKKVQLGTEEDVRKRIIEKGYFTLEELSRISSLLMYNDLDRDTKKRILLESKLSELAKKRARYKRQFGIDIITDDGFVEAILDSISNSEIGMRSVNNIVKRVIDTAERTILENEGKGYKKLVFTKDSVSNPKSFDLS